MHHHFLPFLTLVATVALSPLLLGAASAESPIYTTCNNASGTFASSDPYARNLANLEPLFLEWFRQLPGARISLRTSGENTDSTVYGLAQCRGDVSLSACTACVSEATAELIRACPAVKEGIIWYDRCMIRYAPTNFFGVMEDGFRVFVSTMETVPNPADFNRRAVALVKRVSSEAYGNERTLFGTEEADVVVGGKKEKLYSLAQCTGDVKPKDCQRCLQDILGNFPNCCDGKRGGRVLAASCNFRYELFRFY